MDANNSTSYLSPSSFPSFAAWLRAATRERGRQRQLAAACGVSPQAVQKWLQGGAAGADALHKIAVWAGVDYIALRLLCDGKPVPFTPPAGIATTWSLPEVISHMRHDLAGQVTHNGINSAGAIILRGQLRCLEGVEAEIVRLAQSANWDQAPKPARRMRSPLAPGLRFRVFHRDRFTCQYCGSGPPDTVLEVDHVVPVARGGTDDIGNLVAACRDCNGGKWSRKLVDQPKAVQALVIAQQENV